jgi:hypothetical protein
MDLNKLELKDLQALAYEQIVLLKQTEQNIKILESEIYKRKDVQEVKEEKKGK